MGLREYRRKRNFGRTPEPAGSAPKRRTKSKPAFVIQKHAARRLHYDFRLELDGVLKSWAVPKGPSLDPAAKRLAVHVEDHPLEYGEFEGVIPRGEYGGGTVMLWDSGWWEPLGDAAAEYAKGNLKFILHGSKLRGKWALVRMKSRRDGEKADNWLLIKEQDGEARPGSDAAIVERETHSVATSRDMPAIAADADRVWSSKTGEVTAKGRGAARAGKPRRNHARDRCRGDRRRPTRQGPAADRAAARECGNRRAGGRRLAARDQVRWLPDARPAQARQGRAAQPQRPRLDEEVSRAGGGAVAAAGERGAARWRNRPPHRQRRHQLLGAAERSRRRERPRAWSTWRSICCFSTAGI